MHHIFVNENLIDVNVGKIEISKDGESENFNHLVRVLRVNVGEHILCSIIPFNFTFDYRAKVSIVTNDKIVMDIEENTKANELTVKINLYQGLPKSDKFEFIIEKAVELGVYSITPVNSEFSVVKLEENKIKTKIERYNKISKSAAEQSKRNIIPEVRKPICFDDMIKKISGEKNILFYENAKGISKTKEYIKCIKDEVNVIIGPEGGFSDKEIEKAKNAGIEILSLGERILRVETAAVSALSIFMYELQN